VTARGTRARSGPSRRPGLAKEQLLRYSRHLLLPEVGAAGQRRLLDGRVLIVGAGGLGAPTSLYLAAAGVGHLGLVDFDAVDGSNLQRQVLYSTSDIGHQKLEAAQDRLRALNPDVEVTTHPVQLTRENALEILRPYDLVIDGTDNFPTRYLVNDACVLLGKPLVYASIYRFEGQASVFDAKHGPCYRCLYPEPPPPELVPSCAEGGVLGVLPGLLGVIQATEALKLLLGIGEPLRGRLLLVDALGLQFRELRLRKNPACPVCSAHPTQHGLIDYPAFCGVPAPSAVARVPEVEAEALAQELHGRAPPFLLDVREPGEYEIVHLEGAQLIPQGQLSARAKELPKEQEIVVYCKSGRRSERATQLLLASGFPHVRNLRGGIDAWTARVDPSLPRY
jgi:sulfur-carrier protein adenylyltransferase/sulfurtransferase